MMAEVCDLSCLSRLSVSKSKLLHDCRFIHGVVPTLSPHLKNLENFYLKFRVRYGRPSASARFEETLDPSRML